MMVRLTRTLLALALGGPGTVLVRGENMQECIDPAGFDPEKDYFPHKATVEVAEYFTVEYHKHYKVVTNPEDDKTYVLVQCGAPAPSAEDLAAVGVTDVDFTIDVPLTNVALEYSTMEAFFGMLGARRTVQAILGTSYATESCMMQLVDDGLILELDHEQASANASYVNEQGLLATNPTLEREFSVDNMVGFVGRTGWNSREYPFPFVRSSTTLEPTREGLFEKVKFFAAFLNKEERANYLWDQMQPRINCVQANAAEIEVAKGNRTKILWAVYSSYCKGWDVARTGPFYYHDFAKVCSAELLHAEMGGNMVSENEACVSPERRYMSQEEFQEFGKDADVWLWSNPNPPPLDDASVFTDEVKAFKAFQAQEVYWPGGSTGWYDQANMQPDVLIEDICSVAGTLDLEEGAEYQRKWYSNVFTLDVNTPNPTCKELGGIDAPRETSGSDCAFRTLPGVDEAKPDEDGIVCPAEWKPVCGSDDKVYSNDCEAGAAGQEVKYEIESPDDSVTAGKDCPPESPDEDGTDGADETKAIPIDGWELPYNGPKQVAASVGDTITFSWSRGGHNVYIHPTMDCTLDGRIGVGNDAAGTSYTFAESDAGNDLFFSCDIGEGAHCNAGQSLTVSVAGGDGDEQAEPDEDKPDEDEPDKTETDKAETDETESGAKPDDTATGETDAPADDSAGGGRPIAAATAMVAAAPALVVALFA